MIQMSMIIRGDYWRAFFFKFILYMMNLQRDFSTVYMISFDNAVDLPIALDYDIVQKSSY